MAKPTQDQIDMVLAHNSEVGLLCTQWAYLEWMLEIAIWWFSDLLDKTNKERITETGGKPISVLARRGGQTKRAVEKEGRRCIMLSGDVADSEFCRDAVEKTVDELGKLDILVNNAAFQEHVNSLEELTEEHFDRTIKTNLVAIFSWPRRLSRICKTGAQSS